jgi:predicted ATPase
MLTELQIKNFKGWKDTGKIRMAPITVLFGTNSSGKSSIGQFLMMLKQTAESSDKARVLHPGDKSTPVDLGSFSEVLFGRDLTRELSFSIAWSEQAALQFKDVISERTIAGRDVAFDACIVAASKEEARPVCREFAYALKETAGGTTVLTARMKPHKRRSGKYDLECQGIDLIRQTGRPWELPGPIHFYGFPDETSVYFQNATALLEFPFALQKLLKRLFYLGPLREHPARQYPWAGDKPEQVGFAGENWVGAILAARNRKISPGKRQVRSIRAQPFEQVIARWLKELGLIHSFSVESIKGTRDYRVLVQVNTHSEKVSIPDVGFGVSQILPVLVQCFYAPPDSTIVIEQPELHLHPSIQQGLADLFIEVIRSREDGNDRRIQLIVESHSEHFLRRLQRRIADQTVDQEDVAAYFCSPGKDALTLGELQVDMFGNILNWPPNFFGDQMTDVAEMTKEGHRRRREQAAEAGKGQA